VGGASRRVPSTRKSNSNWENLRAREESLRCLTEITVPGIGCSVPCAGAKESMGEVETNRKKPPEERKEEESEAAPG